MTIRPYAVTDTYLNIVTDKQEYFVRLDEVREVAIIGNRQHTIAEQSEVFKSEMLAAADKYGDTNTGPNDIITFPRVREVIYRRNDPSLDAAKVVDGSYVCLTSR